MMTGFVDHLYTSHSFMVWSMTIMYNSSNSQECWQCWIECSSHQIEP